MITQNGVTHLPIFFRSVFDNYAFRDFIIFLLLYEITLENAWKSAKGP